MKFSTYIIWCGLLALELCADTNTWQSPTQSGLWTTTTNWSLNTLPTSVTTAIFPDLSASSPYTITVTGSQFANILQFTSNNQYTIQGSGSISLYQEVDILGNSPQIISCNITLSGSSPIAFNMTNAELTLNGNLSGSTGITVSGGILFLYGTGNSYSGVTHVLSNAILTASSSAASLSNNSLILLEINSELDLGNQNNQVPTINTPLMSATDLIPQVNLGSATLTISSPSGSFYGYITGSSGGLTLSGPGTLTIATPVSNSNDYSGTTSISNAGVGSAVLAFAAPGSVSPNSIVSIGTNGVLDISASGVGTVTIPNISGTGNANLNLGANELVFGSNNAVSSFAGTITAGGDGWVLNKVGTSSFTLTATISATNTGTIQIDSGTFTVSGTNVLGSKSSVVMSGTSTLNMSAGGTSNQIANLSGASGNSILLGSNTITVNDTATKTFAGTITGTSSAIFSKAGTTTLTLSNSAALSSFSGGIVVNGGNLDLQQNSAITIKSLNGSLGTLTLDNSNLIVTLAGPSAGTYSGVVAGSGGLTIPTGATFTMTGNNTYSGQTILQGTAILNASGGSPSTVIVMDSGTTINLQGNYSVGAINDPVGFGVAGTVNLGTYGLSIVEPTGTFSGSIAGAGGLTVTDIGSWTIASNAGNNTYSGTTSITNHAVLIVGNTSALSTASVVSLGDHGQLSLSGNDAEIGGLTSSDSTGLIQLGINVLQVDMNNASSTFAGQITSNDPSSSSPTNGLTLNGPGTLTLTGTSNNYTGTTILENAVVLSGNASALSPNTTVNLKDTSQLNVNGTNTIKDITDDTLGTSKINLNSGILTIQGLNAATGPVGTYTGQITGIGGLTIINAGNFVLNNSNSGTANNYQGVTSVKNQAFLTAETTYSLSPNSSVNLVSGALNITLPLLTDLVTIKDLSADLNSIVNLNLGVLVLGSSDQSTTCEAQIAGVGAITKQGSQTFTLKQSANLGQNSYSGVTTINGGTLSAGNADAFSYASIIQLNTGILDANVYASAISDLNGLSGTKITINNSGANLGILTIGVSGQASPVGTYLGKITGTGSFVITNSGNYTLSPTLANDYSGLTTVSGNSTLNAGVNSAFSANSIVQVDSGSILSVHGFNNAIAGLTGAGTVALGSPVTPGNTLSIGGTNLFSSFSGAITSTGSIGITKVGTGTFTLSGAGLNTYSGLTIISTGTLAAGDSVNDVFSHNSVVQLSSGAILNNNGRTNQIGNLTGAGGTVILGASGTLSIGVSSQPSAFGGGIVATLTSTSGGNLTILASATVELSGTGLSTYGGTTYVAGTLQAANPNVFSPNSTVNIADTGMLDLNDFDNTIGALSSVGGAINAVVELKSGSNLIMGGNGAVTTYDGVIQNVGNVEQTTGKISFSQANTYTGSTTITGGGTIVITNDNQLGNGTNLFLSSGTLEINAAGQSSSRTVSLTGNSNFIQVDAGTFTLTGPVQGSGGVTKSGAGTTLVLNNGATDYTGPTSIAEGTLRAGGASTLSAGSEITISSGAVLDLNNNSNQIANLSGQGNVTLGTALLTVGNAYNGYYYGVISGTGGQLTKTGSGTLTLYGISTYTGATEINEGSLSISGQISSDTTVNLGGTLRGTGQINGSVTCYGTTAPGNSIGTLTVAGPYTAASGSNFEVELNSTTADKLVTTTGGVFTIDSNATLTVIPFRGLYSPRTQYVIVEAAGGVVGEFDSVVTTITKAAVEVDYSVPNEVILFITVKAFSDIGLSWNAINVAKALDRIMELDPPEWSEELDVLFYLSEPDLNDALNQLDPAQLKGFSIIQQNNAVRVQNGISLRFQNFLDKMKCPRLRGCNFKRSPVYLWVDGFNSKLRQPSNLVDTNPQVGYRTNTGGGSMGIDMNFAKHGYVGLMGAGTYSDIKWVNGQGKGHITTAYAGIYASWLQEKRFVNFSLLGSTSSYGALRNIIYPGVFETATSEHNGLQLLTHLDLGLNFYALGITFRPFESLDFIIQHENAFQENGAGVYNLDVQKTNPQMFRNELGLNFSKCFNISKKSRILADLKLSWVSESRMKGTLFTSNFVNYDDITFQTKGYYPNRNFFSPGASLTGNFCRDSAYITVSYDAEIGNHYLDQRTGFQLGIKF